ncbi:PLAT/LH2 domain-containing protein [Leifsonia sp. NPDC058248]|uniref:PLAT/LH2 domain-containing protein n=1 Tax=Leifsonia sp. NPDC058248 TaxID=3346402 RepID=UPI0036DDC58F
MALMQPIIAGPLSELSSSIRVRGQLAGSTVTIETDARTVAKAIVQSGDERIPLEAGVTLKPTELLFAIQHLGGDQSDPPSPSQMMPVGPAPSAGFGMVNIATHLFSCGRYVWIDGATPGADITLSASGSVLGTGKADEGVARLTLTNAIPAQGLISAHQSGGGLPPGPDVSRTPDRIPGAPGQLLPAPVITLPVRGCDPSVGVTGVFDGALVTIERASGIRDQAGFDRDALTFVLSSPLKEGDELTIRQEVDRKCERPAKTSDPVEVGPVEPVDAPTVLGPLCADTTTVRVTDLRPGATLHLVANQTTYDGQVPPEQTWMDCRIPGLSQDPVTATQECCGVMSPPATPVRVDPHDKNIPAAELVLPLYGCTGAVCITRARPGSLVQVFMQTPIGDVAISDQVFVTSSNSIVGVAPLLVEGSTIFVRQWACGGGGVDSVRQVVQAHPELAGFDMVQPLFAGDTTVNVRGAVPGATVDLYTGGSGFLGSAVCDALHPVTVVHLIRPLTDGDHVSGREVLCGMASQSRGSVSVNAPQSFGPRPFYIVGHNPNTVADAVDAVIHGANGLEPDVQVYEDDASRLCISHGTGEPSAPTVAAYLDGVHQHLVNSGLSLVVFDCKSEATSADRGYELLMTIREHLTFDNDINVIISVGKLDEGGFFDRIIDILGPREGLMIDAEDDPGAVTNYFTSRGLTHQGYGNGISFANFALGPYYRYTLEAACGIRAQAGRPSFIYVWTVNAHDELREYIRIGVDGIITDDPHDLVDIAGEAEFASLITLATRTDNPFAQPDFAYGLHIHTADRWMAGTDANVTFTLTGTLGSTSKTVDTSLIRRMERDDWNWVTLPSNDLGTLQTLTVQRDNDGNGPDWYLDRIEVHSARYGTGGTASFDRDVDSTSPFTVAVV